MEKPAEERELYTFTLEVAAGQITPVRLDTYITNTIENATRSKVQKGIKEGQVLVNGRKKKGSYIVQAGDKLECTMLRSKPIEAIPEDIALDIVYEDNDLIIVNKPAGMVVHPAFGHRSGTLVNALLHHLGAKKFMADDEVEGLSTATAGPRFDGDVTLRPGIVHRLDKDTSGLLLVAKNDFAHSELAKQFIDRTIQREYTAIVWGVPDPPAGRIETQVGRDRSDRRKIAILPEGLGKHAITNYEIITPLNFTSLVKFKLETGRTHQIRVHAKHIGHPILGDLTYDGINIRYGYGHGQRKAFYNKVFKDLPRQALHARTIGFTHPISGEEMFFSSDLPADMQHVWDQMKNHPVEGVPEN